MKISDFSLDNYRNLITALLSEGYNFVTFNEYCRGVDDDYFVVLRHDVDKLPQNALRMARIEHDLGVKSTYYFRKINGSFESQFIREIAALGHEIGYHYEDFSAANGDVNKAICNFKSNLSQLRELVPVSTIAMHGAPLCKSDNRFLWLLYDFEWFNIIGEPYITPDFTSVAYLSDTGGHWNNTKFSVRDKTDGEVNMPSFNSTCELIEAVKNGSFPQKIILLSHPQRWSGSAAFLLFSSVAQWMKNYVKYLFFNEKSVNSSSFHSLKKKINNWLTTDDMPTDKRSLYADKILFMDACENDNRAVVNINNRLKIADKALFLKSVKSKMSKAEFLGRLYYCGFDVDSVECYNGFLFAFATKINDVSDAPDIHYGLLIKLPRIGLNGKWFYVYKIRTMYPYSEYLQDYLSKNVTLKAGGKYADDFRITKTGKWLRRIWIDEVPNIINIFRGDMKLVGVRPLSKTYYNLYDEDLKIERLKYKPGLLPPFYADNPITLDDIQNSERKYLRSVMEKGLKNTDREYLKKIIYNIIFKHRRSE